MGFKIVNRKDTNGCFVSSRTEKNRQGMTQHRINKLKYGIDKENFTS